MARTAPGPDIAEDRSFQERFWSIERIAWIGFALLIALALLGVFGSGGPFSSATVTAGSLRIEHPTMARWQAGDDLSVSLGGPAGERRLVLASTFADAFRLDDLQPQPERVEAVPLGHVYVFRATSVDPLEVRIAITPRRPGYVEYAVGADSDVPVRLGTFVWP
jgi:hypothetical protein